MIRSPALEFVHITMKFGTFTALDDINLTLEPHLFHVLLGENGAGKSTLVKCLIGYQKPTSGGLVVNGQEVEFDSPRQAFAAGLGMVYQHFTLADQLSVLENFLLSRTDLPLVLNLDAEARLLEGWMKTMPFQIPLHLPVGTLSAGEKQKLEILIQLFHQPSLLILDEPSSVLTPAEADEVLGLLKVQVQQKNLTVVLITHKFREVLQYGDTVSILRKGKLVSHGNLANYDEHSLGSLMVGNTLETKEANSQPALETSGPVRDQLGIEVQHLSVWGARGAQALNDLSFRVQQGEIYGLAGISGNGQKELMEVLMGLHPEAQQAVRFHGQTFRSSRRWLRQRGVSLLPELPLQNACLKDFSIWENLMLHSSRYKPKQLKAEAERLRRDFGLRAAHLDIPLRTLSGGNIQRTVLARELRPDTQILIVSNPCFGLDFQATAEIHQRLRQARNDGAALLLMSEDLDEILELSDRVGVLSEGKILWEGPVKQADLTTLGKAMAGHRGHHENDR